MFLHVWACMHAERLIVFICGYLLGGEWWLHLCGTDSGAFNSWGSSADGRSHARWLAGVLIFLWDCCCFFFFKWLYFYFYNCVFYIKYPKMQHSFFFFYFVLSIILFTFTLLHSHTWTLLVATKQLHSSNWSSGPWSKAPQRVKQTLLPIRPL